MVKFLERIDRYRTGRHPPHNISPLMPPVLRQHQNPPVRYTEYCYRRGFAVYRRCTARRRPDESKQYRDGSPVTGVDAKNRRPTVALEYIALIRSAEYHRPRDGTG